MPVSRHKYFPKHFLSNQRITRNMKWRVSSLQLNFSQPNLKLMVTEIMNKFRLFLKKSMQNSEVTDQMPSSMVEADLGLQFFALLTWVTYGSKRFKKTWHETLKLNWHDIAISTNKDCIECALSDLILWCFNAFSIVFLREKHGIHWTAAYKCLDC